ncbi:tryptophan--tRNA ligase [candidate division WWE3 bacterium RIFOXYC1_FULL_39_7]|uniref:Tryptophan--tRNA ligase n=2 Tax=Katanobacteria TaxID=422282 RepID=A0A1F4X586_UNCKA|nr:MAG: tryptophan--tRNA ligase [candidate division WWE3 bacterium RIFOXYC1_FULL_39_7]OGC76845.1 MAG: tryptophan--tRNA ligase [candidate division WWE3 bacterium RIFOXYD1_FULL_39_9]
MTTKKRILTGDNSTGKLHLGHYVGSLENRVKLQHEYETFILIADMHAYAYPKYVDKPEVVSQAVIDVATDDLAIGLDPRNVKIFVESGVPEIYELGIIFSMITSHARVMRNPTLKEELKVKDMGENYSLGFVNFPILQVADILCVKANLVPVGEDQIPHLEMTNEVVRKFNSTYGKTFEEIEPLVGRIKRLVGTDGNSKMTKSLGNTIYLSEDKDSLRKKVMSMYTDPSRLRATDPGKVEGNPVFMYHDAFNPNTKEVEDLKERYRTGKVGDVEVKEKLLNALEEFIAPIREKHAYYDKHRDEVIDIIKEGTKFTRIEAQKTLEDVREKMMLFRI